LFKLVYQRANYNEAINWIFFPQDCWDFFCICAINTIASKLFRYFLVNSFKTYPSAEIKNKTEIGFRVKKSSPKMTVGIRVCVDRGGTFTDCIAFVPNTIFPKGTEPPKEPFRPIVVKLLSVDPNNYQDAPREGIRRILEIATGISHPRDKLVDSSRLEM
jgi:hypothetical protein